VCLNTILRGQNFFESWLSGVLEQHVGYNPIDTKQKLFLAWQTWDLQRILVYGFEELCKDYCQKYGDDFFLCPKRLNGSAIETLFSQFKDIAGGKLASSNYATVRASYLMRVSIHGVHHGEDDYRNVGYLSTFGNWI
jgi:hypothetical protein